ncbi:MAG: hypothetical protein PHI02_09355 [Sulfurovaceae bacterium]|nr:hypothetical protein [Sulfurovaceae bacterium]
MFFYFILFFAIGVILRYFSSNKIIALGVIISIAILWGITHKYIWGFVSMGEMFLGYFVCMMMSEKL